MAEKERAALRAPTLQAQYDGRNGYQPRRYHVGLDLVRAENPVRGSDWSVGDSELIGPHCPTDAGLNALPLHDG